MTFRIENKFIVPWDKFFDFKNWMMKNNFKKLYDKRNINSVYFDNKNFNIYKDSIEGTTPRKKIRIRTYSTNFLNKKNEYSYEIKVSSAEGRFKKSKRFNNDVESIFNGIYDQQYGMCYPVLNIIYEREYFSNGKSRITIDRNIKYFKINGKRISNLPRLDSSLIIENKSKFLNENTMMEFFIFENRRFSKYCKGIENTHYVN